MLYGGRKIGSFDMWSIVSERVKDLFEAEQFTGARFYPAELVYSQRNKQFKFEESYYVMAVVGRAEIDFAAMGVKCSICPKCGHYVFEGKFPLGVREKKGIYPTIMKEDTWDGSDLFGHNNCTERFVVKILSNKLSGFVFLPFEQKYDAFDNMRHFRTLNGFKRIKKNSTR